MRNHLLLLILLLGLLVACGGGPVGENDSRDVPKTELRRYVDEEAGVACWALGASTDIYCLPIRDTELSNGR